MANGASHGSNDWKSGKSATIPSAIHCILPVTALCYLPHTSLLLAGRGPLLSIYDCQASQLLWEEVLAPDVTVTGIVTTPWGSNTWLALLWAGKAVTVITIRVQNHEPHHKFEYEHMHVAPGAIDDAFLHVTCVASCVCDDHIVGCALCPGLEPVTDDVVLAAAVTAHNALISLRLYETALLDSKIRQ